MNAYCVFVNCKRLLLYPENPITHAIFRQFDVFSLSFLELVDSHPASNVNRIDGKAGIHTMEADCEPIGNRHSIQANDNSTYIREERECV